MVARGVAPADVLFQWIHILRAGWWPGPTFTARDLYPVESRNVVTGGALDRDDWDDLLWVDSDHLPSPLFIERIAEYPPEVAVVGGCYFGREYPFDLQAWDSDPSVEGVRQMHPLRIMELLEQPALHPVGGVGTGWMLIRRSVLEELAARKGKTRIWEVEPLSDALAEELGLGLVIGEDIKFCLDVTKVLGYRIWLDTDARIESAHLGQLRSSRREWMAAHLEGRVLPGELERWAKGAGYRREPAPPPLALHGPGKRKRKPRR